MEKERNCDICFKIKCKSCGWEPNDSEYELLASGKLTNCPVCGSSKS